MVKEKTPPSPNATKIAAVQTANTAMKVAADQTAKTSATKVAAAQTAPHFFAYGGK